MKALLIGIIVAIIFGGAGVYVGRHMAATAPADAKDATDTTQPSDAAAPAEPAAVATVRTVPIKSGQLTNVIAAYGTVVTQPGNSEVFSEPYECRVRRLPAAAGERVSEGTPLIEIEPSPDAKLQFAEAQVALEAAKKDLAQTQQRYDAKLATNSDLLQSQQAMSVAELHVRNLTERGVSDTAVVTLSAKGTGIVSKIDVQEGQIVPAGQPLVETVAQNQIEVRLGVEPGEVSAIKEGQDVKLFPVTAAGSDGVAAKVRLVTQRVNPDTRLVDVFVTPADTNLLLDSFIRAESAQTSDPGLIVPREAVLPGDDGITLFTVKDGHAVKHAVTIVSENNKESLITGDGLKAGEAAVVSGNYELDDAMEVTVLADTPATAPASTEPAP